MGNSQLPLGQSCWLANSAPSAIDLINRNCEFGIVVGNKRYWRQGIGKTVINEMLKMAFKQLTMHRVMA